MTTLVLQRFDLAARTAVVTNARCALCGLMADALASIGVRAAVSNFTQRLAVHFPCAGVCVNALAPGFSMTEQLRFLHSDQATGKLLPRAHKVIARNPMGRYDCADDKKDI